MSGRRLEARERRTIAVGATLGVLALALALVVLPTARRWLDREETIRAGRTRVAQLRGLVVYRDRVIAGAREREEELATMPVRLLRERTPALLASALQVSLQDAARASRVSIRRLEVAVDADSATSSHMSMPATISAVGDIYGLAELLAAIQHGRYLLEVRELRVASNSVLRGELLEITLVVRAPSVLDAQAADR